MAASELSADELRALVVDLVGCVRGVVEEVDAINETPFPVDDALQSQLAERDALMAAVRRLPGDVRGRLRTLYVRELKGAHRNEEMKLPVALEHAGDDAREMLERARRVGIADGGLWRALTDSHGTGLLW